MLPNLIDMNRKIRIALLVPWLKSKGGVERTMLRFLRDKKYDIDLYTLYYDRKNTFDDFKKFHISVIGNAGPSGFIRKGVNLFAGLLFSKIKNLKDYDIFLISTAGIAEFTVFRNRHPLTIAFSHTPLRVAHSMYDYYKRNSLKYKIVLPVAVHIYRFFEKLAWKHISYAIVHDDEVKNRLLRYGLIEPDKIYKVGPVTDYTKKTRGKTEKIIFYASRFTPYKRQDLAVDAFINSDLPSLGFKLVMGGFVEDKNYFEKVKAIASSRDDIIIKSNLSEKELRHLYQSCYATLFLAINEDTGFVPLESLAYGKPVISVNEGGPKEFIKDGSNGMLVEATVNAVASALNKISDKKYYSKLKSGAIKSEVYDEKKMMKKFDSAIDNILHREKRRIR